MMSGPNNVTSRFRLHFSKEGPLRWTGHLALRQAWERTFRRSRLPLAYSAGHHPQPKLLFAAPLPLGFTASSELLDASLDGTLTTATVTERLKGSCPPGLSVVSVDGLAPREPPITKLVNASLYEVQLAESIDSSCLDDAIDTLLAASQIMRQRRGRTYDLRPLVQHLSFDRSAGRLDMQLCCLPSQTGRPEEVLLQLELDPGECRIHRRKLLLGDPVPTTRLSTGAGVGAAEGNAQQSPAS
jgi:radical SAM-linked protein